MAFMSEEELDNVRNECKTLVTKRASISGGAAIIPLPGVDVGSDVAILMEMIPAINRKFGLTPEQIAQLDEDTKRLVMLAISNLGSQLVGKTITKELITVALKKIGVRVATKSLVKYVPLIGQAAAAGISFGAMKYLGNSHVDECHALCRDLLKKQQETATD
ncbi:Uncharacterized conserved protein, DUF697 family [Kushneria avicenniae]|uniref:Uncharacterized conserved protein, DUF697 family n=1 Tax=Kushneria avicenniae TaxID=402385 RepID=A0A1I1FF97_9GAMM|nr:hypothetical protein [Kushneria avicenniae]SFB96378.1 Uncharacterized conserved protein, DUF697 family [Kushneria avicenniae]